MITFCRATATALTLVLSASVGSAAAHAAASDWVGDAHAAVRLVTAVDATGSGSRLDVGLQFRMAPGWHTYWRSPGDAGVPASVDWQGSQNVAGFDIAWPAPTRLVVHGLDSEIYTDGVVLPASVTLQRHGAPARLLAKVDYAACSNICVPYHAELRVDLPAGLTVPSPEAALVAEARSRVPGSINALGLRLTAVAAEDRGKNALLALQFEGDTNLLPTADLFVEGLPGGLSGSPVLSVSGLGAATLRVPVQGAAAHGVVGKPLTFTLVSGTLVSGQRSAEFQAAPSVAAAGGELARSLAAMLGLALLGGLVLNLMPCVLPVLAMKLLAVAQVAGMSRAQARRGLLATAAGVLASFMALAAGVVALRQAGLAVGWGIQFQQPWFGAGMAVATALFAANLWGWLSVSLPAGLPDAVAAVRSRRKLADAFLSGAFATLLATSCSAPFVGTAVGFGLSGSAGDVILVFAALGFGMAAPLLACAAWPEIARVLPRPGAWMTRLRQALGLALLATTAWLVFVLSAVSGPPTAAALAIILAVLLATLAWRRRSPGASRRWAGAMTAALAVLAILTATIGNGWTATSRAAAPTVPAFWTSFDPAAIGRSVADGKVVMVDVSAAWCLTCKLNEATVLDRAPVRNRLRAPGVVAMRADWSRPDAAITAYLQSFGRYGVPMDAIYGPGAPRGILLPELLTAAAVTDRAARRPTS